QNSDKLSPMADEFASPENRAPADDVSRLRVFAYTVESHAPVYRSIMRVFAEGKERYQIHFRPDQVAAELGRRGFTLELPEGGLERALDQLTSWGNLRRTHDTGRVATLEDFRRRHFLYQITTVGEAAERAVGAVVDALADSGSLQTVMLGAILRNLAALAAEMRREGTDDDGPPRPSVLYEALFNVTEQFKALTENASFFLAKLHEAIDAGEVRQDEFLVYKEAVIAYLQDFIRELSEIAPRIVRALDEIEASGVERMVTLAAEADPAPTLDGRRDVGGRLRRQWRGVAAWFLGKPGQPPTMQLLREAALNAIDRILRVLERIHEKRFRRANRTVDLLRLAAWFEDEDQVGDVHRLFQDAFGLFSARHLGGLGDGTRLVQPAKSWAEAVPVELAPALRESRRRTPSGRVGRISDHSAARRRLRERHEQRRRRREGALERFAGRGPQRLGELAVLDDGELGLLLEFLDRLLALPADGDGVRRTRSRDGRLVLLLEAPAGDRPPAVVRTARGRLTLPDFALTVGETLAQPSDGDGRRAVA
ncbi:MAG: TIGR02677 family protein, partial [Thermoanaerobaculia bacterium]